MNIEAELEDLKSALLLAFQLGVEKAQAGNWSAQRRKGEVRVCYMCGPPRYRSYCLAICSLDSFGSDGSIRPQDAEWALGLVGKMLRQSDTLAEGVQTCG